MIERYSRKEMRDIFSDENRFNAYLKIELYATKAWSKLGLVPEEDVKKIFANAKFNVQEIYELEKETKHDVIAFTRNVSSYLGEEKKWIHYGLTSTDVVDSAYGLLYKQANDIIYKDLLNFQKALQKKALEYKFTPCIGRTHGVHADITSFGLKFALYFDEFNRHIERFNQARKNIEVGKISGAVGTFSNTPPEVQDDVCASLGLESSNISTQTLQRDRHAQYFSTLALIASSIEKIGVEIRHLQRTEVREVEEFFSSKQKGSSAMPHKRNPIASENMAGCARIMRGYMISAYENIPLWHERDISHSSAERILSADATALLDYMLVRFTKVIENLTVFKDKMLDNIFATNGVIFAQKVMSTLIEKHNFSREKAYDLIQPLAMQAWFENISFKKLLLENSLLSQTMSVQEIEDCFLLDVHFINVDKIYKRIPGLENKHN